MTTDGYELADQITIPVGAMNISIGTDGTVGYVLDGVAGQAGQLQLARFQNPAGLSSEGGNLYSVTGASGPELLGQPGTEGMGTLLGQHLERSNVEVITELISLITAQRAYEINSRAIRAADEMLATTTDILR